MAAKHGGKLNKSETVQVRFDPILKMAAELAAARERRTMSSFTEMAVHRATKESVVTRDKEGNPVSAWQVAHECWHEEPGIRLYGLAGRYPDLLTIKERKIFDTYWVIDQVVDKALNEPVVVGDGREMFKSLLRFSTWDDFCQYADNQIDLAELHRRVLKIWDGEVQTGVFSWKKSDEYLEEIRKREMNEATKPNPS